MTKLEVGKKYWIKAEYKNINELNGFQHWFKVGSFDELVMLDDVSQVKEAITEREEVTIPKEVADWIEVCRERRYDFAVALDVGLNDGPEKVQDWTLSPKNQEAFARAWLDGYEVKKEPLYTVEIPDPHGKFKHVVLRKNKDDDVAIDRLDFSGWRKTDGFKLTEEEIKRNHKWAWKWAVPVEEDDEQRRSKRKIP